MTDRVLDAIARETARKLGETMPARRTSPDALPQPGLEDLVPEAAADGSTEVRIARHDPRLHPMRVRIGHLDEAGQRRALELAIEHRAAQVQVGSAQSLEPWSYQPTPEDLEIARLKVAVISIDGIEIDSTEPLWAFRQRFYPPPGRVAFGRQDEWSRVVSAFMRAQDS